MCLLFHLFQTSKLLFNLCLLCLLIMFYLFIFGLESSCQTNKIASYYFVPLDGSGGQSMQLVCLSDIRDNRC